MTWQEAMEYAARRVADRKIRYRVIGSYDAITGKWFYWAVSAK